MVAHQVRRGQTEPHRDEVRCDPQSLLLLLLLRLRTSVCVELQLRSHALLVRGQVETSHHDVAFVKERSVPPASALVDRSVIESDVSELTPVSLKKARLS